MQKIETFRFTPEEIEGRSQFMKSIIGDNNALVFKDLLKRTVRCTGTQPVTYCRTGCDHCIGFAKGKKQPILLPSEFKEYRNLLKSEKDLIPSFIFFSGFYGDPFCDFGKKDGNSVDYYLSLIDIASNSPEIKIMEFITSGYDLDDLTLVKEFFTQVKEREEEKGFNLRMNFSVDEFHAKKVDPEKIRDVIRVMKAVYKNDEILESKLVFVGQYASSIYNNRGGEEYMRDFLDSIAPIFDKKMDLKYRFNNTENGRNKMLWNENDDNLGGHLLTKSKDGSLIIIYNSDKIYEYKLKLNPDKSIDKDYFFKVATNMVLDGLDLKTMPLNFRGRPVVLSKYCINGVNVHPKVRNLKKASFEKMGL